jgi:hypothetical protein
MWILGIPNLQRKGHCQLMKDIELKFGRTEESQALLDILKVTVEIWLPQFQQSVCQ